MHGLFSGGVRCLGDLEAGVDVALNLGLFKSVDSDACLQERIASLRLLLLRLTDFHALTFGVAKNVIRGVDGCGEGREVFAHRAGLLEACIAVGMTLHANCFRAGADHFVGRMLDERGCYDR